MTACCIILFRYQGYIFSSRVIFFTHPLYGESFFFFRFSFIFGRLGGGSPPENKMLLRACCFSSYFSPRFCISIFLRRGWLKWKYISLCPYKEGCTGPPVTSRSNYVTSRANDVTSRSNYAQRFCLLWQYSRSNKLSSELASRLLGFNADMPNILYPSQNFNYSHIYVWYLSLI